MDIIVADNCPGLVRGLKDWLEEYHISMPVRYSDNLSSLLALLNDGEKQLMITSSKWVIDEPGVDVFRKFIKMGKVLVMCLVEEDEDVTMLYEAGIHGLLGRSADAAEFDWCLMELLVGKRYISTELMPILKDKRDPLGAGNRDLNLKLTSRELQVLRLICEGLSDKEIGDRLFLSKRTIDNYRANLLLKLGAKNTGHLVALAYENRLIS
jgi:DNA-binding NarL/FixJ family response regulator